VHYAQRRVLTVDILSRGLAHRDNSTSGTLESVSTWYHVWAVSDGAQVSLVLSTSATAPDLGGGIATGWDYYAFLGSVYNDSGGNFVDFTQYDDTVYIAEQTILTGNQTAAVANTYGSVTFNVSVPTTAAKVFGNFGNGANAVVTIYISPIAGGFGVRSFVGFNSAGC
jgi:hypothetical protein